MAVKKILLGNVKGPTGPQGPTGPTGPQGVEGPRGEQGLTGATGPQGEKGAQGDKGDAGPVGATGPQGPAGATGPQGPEGPQGVKGDTGHRGSRWVTGTMITGTDTTAKVYPTGIADSLANDHYLNVQTNHYYRCQTGGDADTATWMYVGTFSEAENAKLLNGLKAEEFVSNENLLINSDFKNPVNSRGLTSYGGYQWTIDKWFVNYDTTVTVNDGYITIGGDNNLRQTFDEPLANGTYTATIRAKSDEACMVYLEAQNTIAGVSLGDITTTLTNEWEEYTFTFTGEPNMIWTGITGPSRGQGLSYDVEWIKLEKGSVATPFIPPNKEVEKLKCGATVGDAESVNGFKIYKSLSDIGCTTASTLSEVYLAVPYPAKLLIDGTTLTDSSWNLPHTAGVVEITRLTEIRGYLDFCEKRGTSPKTYRMYITDDAPPVPTGTWANIADGGNANKLGGYEGTKYVRFLGQIADVNFLNDATISYPYECVITTDIASAIGLPPTYWYVKFQPYSMPHAGYSTQVVTPMDPITKAEDPMFRVASGTNWYPWKYYSGGNADTVDGLQGSAIVATKTNFNSTDLSHANIPAESGVWSTPATGLTGLPTGWGDARHNLTRLYNGNASYSLDFLASYTQMLAWRMGKEWREILDSNNYKKFALPLDGSVPMSGFLKASGGVCEVGGDGNHASIGVYNTPSDYSNSRRLMLMNSNYIPDHKDALQFWDNVNGAVTPYVLLHNGNSQKVATSPSAPSDTTALWVVPGN